MTNKNGVYISKGNWSFKINDHNDISQVCQRDGSTEYISNLSSIRLNPTTNSLEKANDFNGIILKFNFNGTTRKYSGNVEGKWLLYIDDMLVDGYSQDVFGDLM